MVKDCAVAEHHPCTQGHFPGQPVVPGAYLAALIETLILEDMPDMRVASIRKIKFLKPLTPGVAAELSYERVGQKVQFRVYTAAETIVEGSAVLAAA